MYRRKFGRGASGMKRPSSTLQPRHAENSILIPYSKTVIFTAGDLESHQHRIRAVSSVTGFNFVENQTDKHVPDLDRWTLVSSPSADEIISRSNGRKNTRKHRVDTVPLDPKAREGQACIHSKVEV